MKRIVLPAIFLILGYGFFISPNFKEIAAGVAIFLFGMLFLEEGFKAFTGGVLENLLKRSTGSLTKSIGFGIVTTSIMQSSSLVSVIAISFLSAGLISLAGGIGIIFGANIGTTTGAWLLAGLGLKVNIASYAMPMLVFGIVLVLQPSRSLKGFGQIMAGVGFLFLGIHHMKEGFEAFRASVDLTAFAIDGLLGLLVYTGVGMAATVIMQSSHATLVLIITALGAQQITYENGLALAIGANIGTTISAIIGALSSNYQGKRLAGAHLIFNVMTGLVAIIFIQQFVWVVDAIAEHVGIAPDNYTLKLAVFHSVFNLVGVALMIPLINRLVAVLSRAIPEPKGREMVAPIYLNESVVDFPETLREAVKNESIRLYDFAFELIAHGVNLHRRQILSDLDFDEIIRRTTKVFVFDLDEMYETKTKALFSAILSYTSRVPANQTPDQTKAIQQLRKACGDIVQSVKEVKHLRKNLSRYILSNNEDIRREYNQLRKTLGELLRTIGQLRAEDREIVDVLDLDAFKLRIDQDNSAVNGTLDRMIREGRITPVMATSLMNDITYTRTVVWKVAEAAAILFGAADKDVHAAEVATALSQEEVGKLPAEDR